MMLSDSFPTLGWNLMKDASDFNGFFHFKLWDEDFLFNLFFNCKIFENNWVELMRLRKADFNKLYINIQITPYFGIF